MARVNKIAGSSSRHGCQAMRRLMARASATSGCSGAGPESLGPVDMREDRFAGAVGPAGHGASLVNGLMSEILDYPRNLGAVKALI